MSNITIQAKKRSDVGKSKVKALRKEGIIPAVYYKGGEEAISIAFEEKALNYFLTHGHSLIDLKIEGIRAPQKCVVRDIQYHPVTERVLHVDFLGVSMDEELEIEVPVVLVGEAPGVKAGGVLEQLIHEVMVSCLPQNLPEAIEVDISKLQIGDALHVEDIKIENVEILHEPSDAIVKIEEPKVHEEPEAAEEEEAEEAEEEEEEE
jgi:large subunit ribosomal protein L25